MSRVIYTFSLAAFSLAAVLWPAMALAEPDPRVLEVEAERIAAIERASRSTVAIFAKEGQGGGSGVIISPDGYALSNFHVTQPAGNAMKCGLNDGRIYDAVIVGIDPTGDVALIKLLGRDDFPAAVMADSNEVRAGDWCFAAGNPFLLANDFQPSISYGLVSGVHRYQYPAGTLLEYADCLQTDAAINPGNSGGPLFNLQGELIGVNGRASFEKRGRVNVGVGYAISINQIKNFLGYLKSGRIVDHATLGATVITDADGRVVVDEVLETSDAYRRGLRYDDEIVSFGGRSVQTVNAFKNVLGIYPRGWQVPLTYRREGQSHEIMVRLAGVHRSGELEEMVRGERQLFPQEKPEEKPEEEGEKKPDPLKLLEKLKAKQLPKIAAEHFEARRGYANYYFNRQRQDRIWNGLLKLEDFTESSPRWQFEGTLARGGSLALDLAEEAGSIRLPVGESKVAFTEQLGSSLNPPGSGGLLLALHIWQRFLRKGPRTFGEVYYLGTMPLAPGQQHLDVLVGLYGGTENRFYFDPASGELRKLETFPDEDLDPCEVYFTDYREIAGRTLPHNWRIVYRGREFASVEIESADLPSASSTTAEN